MKKIICILSIFLFFCNTVKSQNFNPWYYDKAKHYQYRSMEVGPWKFYPKWYYNLFYSKYKRRYRPNATTRAEITATAEIEKNNYVSQNKEVKEWTDRELMHSADRTIDVSYVTISEDLEERKKLFLENMTIFTKIGENMEDLNIGARLLDEYNRIMENKDIIAKSHMENSKRQIAYNNILKEMDTLNETICGYIKIIYNKNINKEFFK